MRLCTVVYISVICSLYMFRVVTPPIIRSTYNCNHSIWHWSNRLCYLPLSWSSWNWNSSSCSTTTEGSRDGLTSARCCDYSYMCTWWWMELPPETCRASSLQKYNKLYIIASRKLFTLIELLFVHSLLFVLFYVLLVCKCILCYCHRVPTQLQLTNISYHIIYI